MQNRSTQKYFNFLAFMLMVSTYLPLLYLNAPPVIRSHHIWTMLWGISLLLLQPKIFFNKAILYILAYGLLLFLATITIWSNIDEGNRKGLLNEFYQIAIGLSVIIYFLESKNHLGLALIAKWSIIFIIITAIMTIISSAIDPMYARNIIGSISSTSGVERENILEFRKYGGGNYSTAVVFMCIFPVFIYYYKNIKLSLISKKMILFFSVVIFLALLGMQIFANILIAVSFGIIALLGVKKINKSILIVTLFLGLLILIPTDVYVKALTTSSNLFENDSELNSKINDLAKFINIGAEIDNSTATGGRAERYPILMSSYVKSPILGCYYLSSKTGNGYDLEGAHLFWMNKLTVTGLIGLIVFTFILYKFIMSTLRHFNPSYKFYYILASLSILCYGLTKAVGGRETWYAFFIILPGLYYLPLLKKSK